MRPSDWVEKFLWLQGEPFSIADYPYLKDIYNCPYHDILLNTARQVSKSTTISSMLVETAANGPMSSQILVSPLAEQAAVFSTTRLREFIHDSPLIRQLLFSGPNVIDQVLRKQFNNGSLITLGYAQRTADRLRGRSITRGSNPNARPILGIDEAQDVFPEVLPVLLEMAFRTPNARYLYAGTPKSFSGPLQKLASVATGNEWAVRCQATGCKKWNHSWTEKNIGDTGVICEHCGKPLDVRIGQWVSARQLDVHKGKDARVTRVSFRIPQLIVYPVMSKLSKWLELLGKLRVYSTERFNNEVLGLPYDSAAQPTTLEQLEACCDQSRRNELPRPDDGTLPPLVMGVDWAFTAVDSYTVVTIGGWAPFPHKFHLYYYKVFRGAEADSIFQEEWILKAFRERRIRLIAPDYGCGQRQNLTLINALGENCVAQMQHTGMRGAGGQRASRAKWEPKTRKWHLARTRVLTDTFEAIRHRQITFPRKEDCRDLFDHILAEKTEYRPETNTLFYTNIEPDDALHSLTYCMLGGELLLRGDFRGHLGSEVVTPAGYAGGVYDDMLAEDPHDMALYQ